MIDQIRIQNFQVHKALQLDFLSGVNVIAGSSDAGKSSIVRALLWAFQNKPQGIAFRNNEAEGDLVFVRVKMDDHTLIRKRSENVNTYELDKTVFKAMGSSVPEDIENGLNVRSINTQSQMEGPYLLNSSAGEVARILNEVCDLSVIDRVISNTNALYKKTEYQLESVKSTRQEAEQKFKETDWVLVAAPLLDKAESIQKFLEERQNRQNKLRSLIFDLERNQSKLEELQAEIPDLSEVKKSMAALSVAEKRKNGLSSLISEMEHLAAAKIAEIDNKKLEKIYKQRDHLVSLQKRYESLGNQIQEFEGSLSKLQVAAEVCQNAFKALSVFKKCPTCGAYSE